MKYPYELSEQRLSLLPIREQNRYRYEHSDFFDYEEKQKAISEYKKAHEYSANNYYNALLEDNQEELTSELDDEYRAIAEAEADEQAECIFNMLDEILKPVVAEGGLTEEEYTQMSEQIKKELRSSNDESLNEDTTGPDMTFWMNGPMKFITAGFGAVFGTMAGLIMAGHTKAAINKLEDYMNRVVEMCDDGIQKDRSLFHRLGNKISAKFDKIKNWFKKKDTWRGNRSYASFREVQENYLSVYASNAMVLVKSMGFVSSDMSEAINQIESNKLCQQGSGLYDFNVNIAYPINKLVNKN